MSQTAERETGERDYRDTVFLPTTSFPMRGDLPKKEPAILARWERMGLWEQAARGVEGAGEVHPA